MESTSPIYSNCRTSSHVDLTSRISPKMKGITGWTRVFEDGVLYYKRPGSDTRTTHPCYDKLLTDIAQFKNIRFPSHRIAFQLKMVQERARFALVSFYHVVAAFNHLNLRTSANDNLMSVESIVDVLERIYTSSFGDLADVDMNQNYFKDIALNFIINAYDPGRSGNIEVLSLKVILVLLCSNQQITVDSKFIYLYNQIANHNNSASRKRVAHLLKDIAIVAEYFQEKVLYGVQTIPYAVESCFKDVSSNLPLTEVQFLKWLAKQPQSLVWYSTFFMLDKSEKVVHNVRCKSCKRKPFTGFRYRCTQCLNTTFCQQCFLYDATGRVHDYSHPVREFCDEITKKENRKVMGNIIWNNVKSSHACGGLQIPCLKYSKNDPNHSIGSLLQDSLLHMTPSSVVTFVRPSQLHNTSFVRLSHDISNQGYSYIDPVSIDLSTANDEEKNTINCRNTKNINGILDQLEKNQQELRRILQTESTVPTEVAQQRIDALSMEINRVRLCVENINKDPSNEGNVLDSEVSKADDKNTVPRYEEITAVMSTISDSSTSSYLSDVSCHPVNIIGLPTCDLSFKLSPISRKSCDDRIWSSPLSSISEHSPSLPEGNDKQCMGSQQLSDLCLSPISLNSPLVPSVRTIHSSTPIAKEVVTSSRYDCSKAAIDHENSSEIYVDLVMAGLNDLTDLDFDNELGLNLSTICINQLADKNTISTQRQLDAELNTICFQLQESTNGDDHRNTRFLTEMYNGLEELEKICYIMLYRDVRKL